MVFDQINLTTREHIDNRIRLILFGGMAALVIIISVINLVRGYHLHKERATYQDKLKQLQQLALQLQSAEESRGGQVSPKAYQSLMRKGRRVNRLIALDLFPWIKILDALENALPDVVILDSFRPVEGFARIQLTGRTDSLDKLVQFQQQLAASDIFSTVILENMGLGDGPASRSQPKSKSRMAFQLHCRLRLDQVLPKETHGALWRTLKNTPRTN